MTAKVPLPTSFVPQVIDMEYDSDMEEVSLRISADSFLVTMPELIKYLQKIGFKQANTLGGYLMDFKKLKCFPRENRFMPVVQEPKRS